MTHKADRGDRKATEVFVVCLNSSNNLSLMLFDCVKESNSCISPGEESQLLCEVFLKSIFKDSAAACLTSRLVPLHYKWCFKSNSEIKQTRNVKRTLAGVASLTVHRKSSDNI